MLRLDEIENNEMKALSAKCKVQSAKCKVQSAKCKKVWHSL